MNLFLNNCDCAFNTKVAATTDVEFHESTINAEDSIWNFSGNFKSENSTVSLDNSFFTIGGNFLSNFDLPNVNFKLNVVGEIKANNVIIKAIKPVKQLNKTKNYIESVELAEPTFKEIELEPEAPLKYVFADRKKTNPRPDVGAFVPVRKLRHTKH